MSSNEVYWQDGKTGSECNKYMLTNEVCTDVTFMVGDERAQVRAHKYVLGSRSSFFYAMLFGPMAETSGTIPIPDIEPHIFREILRYLYCEEINIDASNVTSLMLTADKYTITGVVNKCTEYLTSGMTVDSVCTVLDLAFLLQKSDLQENCLDFIFENSEEVLQSESFCNINRESLKLILKSDELTVNEEMIYQSVKKWVQHQCRYCIDATDGITPDNFVDIVHLIRIPLMDREYIESVVLKDNLLTPEEKSKVFQNCVHGKDNKQNTVCGPRKLKEYTCMRSSSFTKEDWMYHGDPDRIDFTVSDSVYVVGFIMCTASQFAEYEIEAKLMESSSVLEIMQTHIHTFPEEKTFRIDFRSSVYINPGVRYTASVKMLGPKTYFAEECKTCVTTGGVTFKFLPALHPTNGTTESSGQIPGIVFVRKGTRCQ